MQPQQCRRIDLGELKALIVKKLGSNKSKQYFYYLNRFLGQKLSKKEFNKSCIRVLGRENIELHNQFIQSILKNVCLAKAPPPKSRSSLSNSNPSAANSSTREDGCKQRGGILPNHNQRVPTWSNGFVPPPSHKSWSISSCDYRKPLEDLQSVAAQLPENKSEAASLRPVEKPRVEDGEEPDKLNSFERPLLAPLGIPLWSAGMNGPCKSVPIDFGGYFNSGGLYDSETLRKRMEQIAISEGLGGVSKDCGNVLNNVMDMYLKRLVRSCVELVGARSAYQLRKVTTHQQQVQGNAINGIWPNTHFHTQSGKEPADVQEEKQQYSLSLLDFKVAMELNPKLLGGDWPLRLEKICMHPFEQ